MYLVPRVDKEKKEDPLLEAAKFGVSDDFTEVFVKNSELTENSKNVLIYNSNNKTLLDSFVKKDCVQKIDVKYTTDKSVLDSLTDKKFEVLGDDYDILESGTKYDYILEQGIMEKETAFYKVIDSLLVDGGIYMSTFFLFHVDTQKKRFFQFVLNKNQISIKVRNVGGTEFPIQFIKLVKGANQQKSNMISLDINGKVENFEFLKAIEKLKSHFLDESKKLSTLTPGKRITYDLYNQEISKMIATYTIHVLDSKDDDILKMSTQAVFVCPHGKEKEYFYSTEAGNFELANMIKVSRLLIAVMNPGIPFVSFDQVKSELEALVLEFKPEGITGNIVFMTDGDNCGNRKLIYQDDENVVEDYCNSQGEEPYRRLISNLDPTRMQAVAKLVHKDCKEGLDKSDKLWGLLPYQEGKTPGKNSNFSEIEFHNFFLAFCMNYEFLKNMNFYRMLILGSGVETIGDMLLEYDDSMIIDQVDMDSKISEIAEKYFYAKRCPNKTNIVADGVEFLLNKDTNNEEDKYDYILIDVNAGDRVCCPPENFRGSAFSGKLYRALHDGGVLFVNVICYKEGELEEIVKQYKSKFDIVFYKKFDNTLNHGQVCIKNEKHDLSANKVIESYKASYEKWLNKFSQDDKDDYIDCMADDIIVLK